MARGDTVLLRESHGVADRAKGRPCQQQTAFQIASISKQMTAAAVLRLAERGSLNVSDQLSRWFPGVPRWGEITVHQLLTHTAGLKSWDDLPRLSLYRSSTARRVLDAFARSRLALSPGTAFRYSSPGYVLLAHIVEQEAGRPYDQELRTMFDEAGMVNTGAGAHGPFPDLDASGYRGERRRPSFDLVTVGRGAGDVWSTVDDLRQWNRALFGGLVMREATFETMLRPHVDVPVEQPGPRSIAYGYAWILYDTVDGPMWFHTGQNAGFAAINAVFPDDDLTVIVLSNEEMTDVRAICSALRAEAFTT
ncbi:MAG TPA: serine hydrolase domain-containing protein [Candidatus Limnocylindria bacterium]|nr:serine hydrolase domain-containing protein [Candidatus Limnocylindria bacterium]